VRHPRQIQYDPTLPRAEEYFLVMAIKDTEQSIVRASWSACNNFRNKTSSKSTSSLPRQSLIQDSQAIYLLPNCNTLSLNTKQLSDPLPLIKTGEYLHQYHPLYFKICIFYLIYQIKIIFCPNCFKSLCCRGSLCWEIICMLWYQLLWFRGCPHDRINLGGAVKINHGIY